MDLATIPLGTMTVQAQTSETPELDLTNMTKEQFEEKVKEMLEDAVKKAVDSVNENRSYSSMDALRDLGTSAKNITSKEMHGSLTFSLENFENGNLKSIKFSLDIDVSTGSSSN